MAGSFLLQKKDFCICIVSMVENCNSVMSLRIVIQNSLYVYFNRSKVGSDPGSEELVKIEPETTVECSRFVIKDYSQTWLFN
jgi:hypothetical protein